MIPAGTGTDACCFICFKILNFSVTFKILSSSSLTWSSILWISFLLSILYKFLLQRFSPFSYLSMLKKKFPRWYLVLIPLLFASMKNIFTLWSFITLKNVIYLFTCLVYVECSFSFMDVHLMLFLSFLYFPISSSVYKFLYSPLTLVNWIMWCVIQVFLAAVMHWSILPHISFTLSYHVFFSKCLDIFCFVFYSFVLNKPL